MSSCCRINDDAANCLSRSFRCALILLIVFLLIFTGFINQPNELKFTVADASLIRFNFSTTNINANNTLSYSLVLNITIRNPNKKGGLYYDNFQSSPITGRRGQQMVRLGKGDVERYESETSSGIYSIDVNLALQLRNVKFPNTESHFEPPQIYCNKLKVPLHSSNVTFFKSID
ncbi:hypothetical protein TIFTF001_008647 [Ficus carica]|uniref:Late embryogenesis abundant protein LEA-2 subgroup domain-containing protein n=1 Tax=Ficus carica TaxID=3494 RepID=A0AA88D0Q6_FICCA|nr:hypothetical protein TIFTF001_008647 [Ficus carica]